MNYNIFISMQNKYSNLFINSKVFVLASFLAISFATFLPASVLALSLVNKILSSSGSQMSPLSGQVDDIVYISSVTEALQTDGNIISVKEVEAEKTTNYITKYNIESAEDLSFKNNIGNGFNGNIFSIDVNSDNKIIVGGDFDDFNGVTHKGLIMLKEDGREDLDFNKNLGIGFNNYIIAVEAQSDDKILVLGTFSSFDGKERKGVVRLNADGTEDLTFYDNLSRDMNEINNFGHSVYTMYTQEDNKTLIGLYSKSFDGSIHSNTIRLNADGTKDISFSDTVSDIFDFNE